MVLFNPSVTTCHLPYILLCKTQRRRLILSYISCLFFSLAVSRSITGCCVSHIEKVARSDGGVEYLQKIYSATFLSFAEEFVTWLPTRDSLLKYKSIPTNFLRNLYPRTYVGYIHDMATRLFCFNRGYIQHFFYMIDPGIFGGKSLVRFPGIDNF